MSGVSSCEKCHILSVGNVALNTPPHMLSVGNSSAFDRLDSSNTLHQTHLFLNFESFGVGNTHLSCHHDCIVDPLLPVVTECCVQNVSISVEAVRLCLKIAFKKDRQVLKLQSLEIARSGDCQH